MQKHLVNLCTVEQLMVCASGLQGPSTSRRCLARLAQPWRGKTLRTCWCGWCRARLRRRGARGWRCSARCSSRSRPPKAEADDALNGVKCCQERVHSLGVRLGSASSISVGKDIRPSGSALPSSSAASPCSKISFEGRGTARAPYSGQASSSVVRSAGRQRSGTSNTSNMRMQEEEVETRWTHRPA